MWKAKITRSIIYTYNFIHLLKLIELSVQFLIYICDFSHFLFLCYSPKDLVHENYCYQVLFLIKKKTRNLSKILSLKLKLQEKCEIFYVSTILLFKNIQYTNCSANDNKRYAANQYLIQHVCSNKKKDCHSKK